jgi:hypothetical protein
MGKKLRIGHGRGYTLKNIGNFLNKNLLQEGRGYCSGHGRGAGLHAGS